MRIKLTIAYDGAPYKGWARQPNLSTIQGELEGALSSITKSSIAIHGSGRTDTGVHAHAQIAHFEAPDDNKIPLQSWCPAINSKLPPTIRIIKCEKVSADFHARFSALSKTYCYTIVTSPVLHPHLFGRAWHIPASLDYLKLQEVLQAYLGSHDFRNFSALRGNESEQTIYTREITQAELTKTSDGLQIRYSANGFLYKMVRILTGVSVQVTQGRISEQEFSQMLKADIKETKAKYCAPAFGLSLESVRYT